MEGRFRYARTWNHNPDNPHRVRVHTLSREAVALKLRLFTISNPSDPDVYK